MYCVRGGGMSPGFPTPGSASVTFQLQKCNESIVELQVDLQNVQADIQSSRQILAKNISAIHQAMQELNTTQVNIGQQLKSLQTFVDNSSQNVQAELQTTRQMRFQLQTCNESIVALQTDLQVSKQTFIDNITNVQTDLLSSKQILVENISATHLVIQKLSTAQANISHQLEHLQHIVNYYTTVEADVYCPALTPPDNGTVSISSGVNYISVGSTATYSCDPGYALLGSITRTCEDLHSRDSVGTWTGSMPSCQGYIRYCSNTVIL